MTIARRRKVLVATIAVALAATASILYFASRPRLPVFLQPFSVYIENTYTEEYGSSVGPRRQTYYSIHLPAERLLPAFEQIARGRGRPGCLPFTGNRGQDVRANGIPDMASSH